MEVGHEIAIGLTGVYDVGYDRGLHYGAAYELSVGHLRVGTLFAAGDTDPRREQHWALRVAVVPIQLLRVEVAFHHFSYPAQRFGENTVTALAGLRWRGIVFDAGFAYRFPILSSGQIHSPFVFDTALFEYFAVFRFGYQYRFPCGFGLGLEVGTINRFEIHNLNYPMFAAVFSYESERIGSIRLDVGFGTNGFFSQGSTIDRGFLRLEYVLAVP